MPARRSTVVWGFPADYNPNLFNDPCELCRSINWVSRPTGLPDCVAWTCQTCVDLGAAPPPASIPD